MNCTSNKIDEYLPVLTCQIMDLDEHTVCSKQDPNDCVTCPILGKFITGESLLDVTSTGHIVCLILWGFTFFVGILGVFNNLLIMIVTSKMKTKRSFEILVTFLAAFDMLCCASATIGTTAHVALYQSWAEKDYMTMQWFHKFNQLTLLCRTVSTYMAMLIIIERFLVIHFPFKMKPWLTSHKTVMFAIGVTIISFLINLPRLLMFSVVSVRDKGEHANIAALADFEYIIGVTHIFGWNTMCLFHEKLGNANEHLDFLAPLPILLVFNVLSFLKVRKIQKERNILPEGQQSDVETLKLFLPVIVAYFLTNIVPFIQFGNAVFTGTFYRELNIAVGLSIVINSAVNFHIYYYQRAAFKFATKEIISKWRESLNCIPVVPYRDNINLVEIGNKESVTQF